MTIEQSIIPKPDAQPPRDLTPLEIYESINAREEVLTLIEQIKTSDYLSQLKDYTRSLPRLVFDLKLTPEEVDIVSSVISIKKKALTYNGIGSSAIEESKKEWSPSDVLDHLPKSGGRDWAERAANDRHDKDE